jgi:ABC-type uncharacterized transport system permease subunit
MNIFKNDTFIRAFKTFLQTFLSCVVAGLAGVSYMVLDQSPNWWLSLGLSAGAAGLSAAWNGVLKPLWDKLTALPADGDVK